MRLSNLKYPIYRFSRENGLFCFKGPSDMYRILNVGSNSGSEGVTIDHYRTRKMVLKHMVHAGENIDRDQFREIYNRCFESYRIKILEV